MHTSELDRLILSDSWHHPDHDFLRECLAKGLLQSDRLLDYIRVSWEHRLGSSVSRSKALWMEAMSAATSGQDVMTNLVQGTLHSLLPGLYDALVVESTDLHSEESVRKVADSLLNVVVSPFVWGESFASHDMFVARIVQEVKKDMAQHAEDLRMKEQIARGIERGMKKAQREPVEEPSPPPFPVERFKL